MAKPEAARSNKKTALRRAPGALSAGMVSFMVFLVKDGVIG
jgi:hypothetical protein